jgi:Tfp pilus assembly protein PilV
LAEIVVALTIITVGMVALLMAFTSALAGSRNIEEGNMALEIANATLEQLRSTAYTNLQSYTADSGTLFNGLTGYTVTVTTTKPADPARIDVTVSWQGKGGAVGITLTTLAANY